MMGLYCKTSVRAECDRCGEAHVGLFDRVDQAKEAATKDGWVVSEWMLAESCARQTIFCPMCIQKLADLAAKDDLATGSR